MILYILKIGDLGEEVKFSMTQSESRGEKNWCQILHGFFFPQVKKFFAPFHLVSSNHVISKLQQVITRVSEL